MTMQALGRQEWLKGVNGRFGEDMEAKRGFSCFGGFEEDRLALTGVWSFEAGWTGQEHLWVLFSCF